MIFIIPWLMYMLIWIGMTLIGYPWMGILIGFISMISGWCVISKLCHEDWFWWVLVLVGKSIEGRM